MSKKYLLIVSFALSGAWVCGHIIYDISKKEMYASLCDYSIYATKEFKIINDKIYCRSSPDSFQMLRRYTSKSEHNKEHTTDIFPPTKKKGETIR